ncbi:MAG: tetratricopeptide repeat protein [Candidatus Aminicenantes bacterium]|nr:tetratricopeptide repeat protein [Candidatus Aminicenantes bacterium]
MKEPSSIRSRSSIRYRIHFFLLILLVCPSFSGFKEISPRTIDIRIAADIEIISEAENKTDLQLNTTLCKIIDDFAREFEKRFELCFRIKDIEYWKPGESFTCIEDCFNNLRRNVRARGSDIVLGIAAAKRIEDCHSGISDYCSGYILIKNDSHQSNTQELKFLILHELCHMFGAVDLDEPNSIMDLNKPGFEIDDFTSRIISLNRSRPFQSRSFPLSRNQLDESISILKERQTLGRPEPFIAAFLVNLLLEKGNYEQAVEECRKGLELNPLQAELISLLGQAYRKTGESDKSVDEFLKALTLKPMNPDLHYHLGLTYLDMDMSPLAIKEFRRAIDLNPESAVFHYNLGVAFAGKGMLDPAICEFRKAVHLREDYGEANTNLAECFLSKGMIEEGIAASEKALELDAEDAYAYSNLGWAYLIKGMMDTAKMHCLKAIELDHEIPQPHNFLGLIYAAQNDAGAALEEFGWAVESNPDYPEAHFNLAELYRKIGNLPLAIHHFKRVIAIDPRHVSALLSLADIHYSQKKYTQAWKYVVEAEKSGTDVQPGFKIKVLNKLGMKELKSE